MSPSSASHRVRLALLLGSPVLALACGDQASSDLELEFRSYTTGGWSQDVGGGSYTSTDGGSDATGNWGQDLGGGGYTSTTGGTTSTTGGYTSTTGGTTSTTGGTTSTTGDYTSAGDSVSAGDGPVTTCTGGTPCVTKKLDEASKLIPDNDQVGAGAVGCPTASMRHQIDGPEAGMTCEGTNCKFTYTLEIRPTMTAAMRQAWNTLYSPPGPDGDPATSDCPGYNGFTHAFLAAFVGWTGNGQASAKVDGNAMACNFVQAGAILRCTYEIPITCNEGSECTGGKADPYDVEVWVQPNGQHRRTFETTFEAQVTNDDDCECTMDAVTGDVADAFDYTTTQQNGDVFEWDPATGQWDQVP